MWAPGIVGLVIGVLLLFFVSDSPEKNGYPPVEVAKPKVMRLRQADMQKLCQNVLAKKNICLAGSCSLNAEVTQAYAIGTSKPCHAEEGYFRQRAEGVPLDIAGPKCAEEPLHLGHGPHILLHLCGSPGRHFMVRLLPHEGKACKLQTNQT